MSDRNCAFCEIVSGHARADIVFETKDVICLLPMDMEVDGHVLLIPKDHHETIFDITEHSLTAVMIAARSVATIFADALGATGINLLHASGKSAQQSIEHFHMHALPRSDNDGINAWPTLPGSRADRDTLLARLRAAKITPS